MDDAEHHNGDGREYLRQKRLKLAKQGRLPREQLQSTAFEGQKIWVDGHTTPSADVLRSLIVRNGGIFLSTPAPGISVCVAARLALGKLQRIAALNEKGHGYPVVVPAWVVDSDRAGTALPHVDYALLAMRDAAQPSARDLFQSHRNRSALVASASSPARGGRSASGVASSRLPRELSAAVTPVAFIENYFSNSRLHFIGSWRSKLSDVLAANCAKSKAVRARSRSSKSIFGGATAATTTTTTVRFVVHVDMDCFFAAVALLTRPDLVARNAPVVICHGGGEGAPSALRKDDLAPPSSSSSFSFSSTSASTRSPGKEQTPSTGRKTKRRQGAGSGGFRLRSSEPSLSSSEVSCPNYAARAFGVKAGMTFAKAKQLCPALVQLPYPFGKFYDKYLRFILSLLTSLHCILPSSSSSSSNTTFPYTQLRSNALPKRSTCSLSITARQQH